MKKEFAVYSKLTCIIVLAAIVALASPVLLAAQVAVQTPLSLVFTATFAPKDGLHVHGGPSMQYEFQAEGYLPATKVALAWGKIYCPQNVLVSLVPKSVVPQETYTAIFNPKVGLGPSMYYEFQVADGPSAKQQEDRFLQTIRVALGWGKEYCAQNVLVSLLRKSEAPHGTGFTQEAVTPNVGVNQEGLVPSQFVFTTKFISRDTGLVIQQEVQADSLLHAARQTLAWSKQHCPEHVLFSIVRD